MTETNPANKLPEKPDPTLKEIIVIRQELEQLQDKILINIWGQIKDINKQNKALLKEVSLLRKNLTDQVAKGFIIGSIAISLISFFIIIFATSL